MNKPPLILSWFLAIVFITATGSKGEQQVISPRAGRLNRHLIDTVVERKLLSFWKLGRPCLFNNFFFHVDRILKPTKGQECEMILQTGCPDKMKRLLSPKTLMWSDTMLFHLSSLLFQGGRPSMTSLGPCVVLRSLVSSPWPGSPDFPPECLWRSLPVAGGVRGLISFRREQGAVWGHPLVPAQP